MIGDAPLSKYTGVPGWETVQEEEKLIALARQYVPAKDGLIVELGVEYGRSTAEFAYACKDKQAVTIHSVDLFPANHHLAKHHGGLYAVWLANLAECGAGKYAEIIAYQGKSYEIGASWAKKALFGKKVGEPIDLLFIDGDHTYEGVTKDIHAWVNHVNNGGVVAFHDVWKNENSHPIHKEVLRAVEDYFGNTTKEWERHDAPDSLLYFVRKVEPTKTVESGASADKADEKAVKTAVRKKSTAKTGKRSAKGSKK